MEHPEQPAGSPNTILMPAGADASPQAVDDERVVLNLRLGWVAEHNTDEVVKRPATSRLKPRLKRDLKTIAAEARLLLDSMKQGLTKLTTRRFRDEESERRKLSSAGALLLLVVFAGLVGVGALVYAGAVQHIFDPEHAADTVAGSSPAAQPQVQPAATTQAAQPEEPKSGSAIDGSSRLVSGLAQLAAKSSAEASIAPSKQSGEAADKVAKVDVIGLATPVLANRAEAPAPSLGPAAAATPATAESLVAASRQQISVASTSVSAPPAAPRAVRGEAFEQRPPQVEQAHSAMNAPQTSGEAPAYRMNFARAVAATGRSRGDMESTALSAIDRGGRVDFDVQHLDRASRTAHAARVTVTGTTLEFIPEGPCEIGGFTVPLAAVTSAQMDQGVLSVGFRVAGELRQLRLRDAPQTVASSHAEEAHLLASLRNMIVAAKTEHRSK